MAKFYYHKLPAGMGMPAYKNHAKELVVVWSVLNYVEAEGLKVVSVFDGEESLKVDNIKHAFDIIRNVEEAGVRIKGSDGSKYWINFVFGNNWDEVIADHSISRSGFFERLMDVVYEYLGSPAPIIPVVAKEV